jgi:hypothetical protein
VGGRTVLLSQYLLKMEQPNPHTEATSDNTDTTGSNDNEVEAEDEVADVQTGESTPQACKVVGAGDLGGIKGIFCRPSVSRRISALG